MEEDNCGESKEEVTIGEVHLPAKGGEGSKEKPALGGSSGAKGKKPQPSSEDAHDDMYLSPLDSASEMYFVGLLVVMLASLWTRLHKIAEPDHVA